MYTAGGDATETNDNNTGTLGHRMPDWANSQSRLPDCAATDLVVARSDVFFHLGICSQGAFIFQVKAKYIIIL